MIHSEISGRTSWRPGDTAVMRTLAALLIANSHLESFYPVHPWLAGDGLLGNGLFYFLSGFGIALGSHSRQLGFFRWYGRRIIRIYPSVIIGVLIFSIGLYEGWKTFAPADYFHLLIFPTGYPFVGHIMTLYLLLFWLLWAPTRLPHQIALGAAAGAYLLFYFQYIPLVPEHEPLFLGNPVSWKVHYFFNSGLAILGALLAPAIRPPQGTFTRDLLVLITVFAVYVGLKFAMVHGHFPRWFILLHVLAVVFCVLVLRVSAADETDHLLARFRMVGWAVTGLAGLTLEMYIVQQDTHVMPWIVDLPSPLNLAVFWVVTIAGAAMLAKAAAMVRARATSPARKVASAPVA